MFNKGVRLEELGRAKDALATYEAVVVKFGNATELVLRKRVAMAMVNKAYDLNQLGRAEDALATCDAVVVRFGNATELACANRSRWR